jgi:hypothetical protein
MAVKTRSVDFFRLVISGLRPETSYVTFLSALFDSLPETSSRVVELGGKTHYLQRIEQKEGSAQLLFVSFKLGERPDVVDTGTLAITPTPLAPTQTHAEWTHALLQPPIDGVYRLLIERQRLGIWPQSIEDYFNELIQRRLVASPANDFREASDVPVSVSIEVEPTETFLNRIDSAERIKSVTVRIVRPNPGYGDLETELGDLLKESDAQRTDITVSARRNASLKKEEGVVALLHDLEETRKLGVAKAEIVEDGKQVALSTTTMGRKGVIKVKTDANGNLAHDSVFSAMDQLGKPSN